MVKSTNFWAGKRVLITGHTGFKGSWLSLWLSQLGANICGCALPASTNPSLFELLGLQSKLDHKTIDIRDVDAVNRSIHGFKPEIVFHMAAQPLVRYSYLNPVETFQTNVMGTINILEAIRQTQSAKAVIVVTSDKCYENRNWVWGYRESEPMGGHDPYSSSKGCAELVVASYRSSYFLTGDNKKQGVGIATVRAGNVIGGGDWSQDRLVPDLLSSHAQGKELLIRNPLAIRPWQFVLEPLGGYIRLAELLYTNRAEYSEAWNFGPREDDVLNVESVIKRLSALLKGGILYRLAPVSNPHEAMRLKLDCSKAAARLDWHPRTTIQDTLELIANWHDSYIAGFDMREVSLKQLKKFNKLQK